MMLFQISLEGSIISNGNIIPKSLEIISKLSKLGHKILIITENNENKEIISKLFDSINVEIVGINKHNQFPYKNTSSVSELIISPKAIGCPMKKYNRFYGIDWAKIDKILCEANIL